MEPAPLGMNTKDIHKRRWHGPKTGMQDEQPILKSCPEFCQGHLQGLSLGDRVQPSTRFGALPTLVDGVVDVVGTEQGLDDRCSRNLSRCQKHTLKFA